MTWVAEMIKPVLNWSLSCNTSLEVKAEHCNHCETTVRNFLCLHLFQHCRILGIAQRIKIASRISHLIGSAKSRFKSTKRSRGCFTSLRARSLEIHPPLRFRESH